VKEKLDRGSHAVVALNTKQVGETGRTWALNTKQVGETGRTWALNVLLGSRVKREAVQAGLHSLAYQSSSGISLTLSVKNTLG
jgi:hypothetical protein